MTRHLISLADRNITYPTSSGDFYALVAGREESEGIGFLWSPGPSAQPTSGYTAITEPVRHPENARRCKEASAISTVDFGTTSSRRTRRSTPFGRLSCCGTCPRSAKRALEIAAAGGHNLLTVEREHIKDRQGRVARDPPARLEHAEDAGAELRRALRLSGRPAAAGKAIVMPDLAKVVPLVLSLLKVRLSGEPMHQRGRV